MSATTTRICTFKLSWCRNLVIWTLNTCPLRSYDLIFLNTYLLDTMEWWRSNLIIWATYTQATKSNNLKELTFLVYTLSLCFIIREEKRLAFVAWPIKVNRFSILTIGPYTYPFVIRLNCIRWAGKTCSIRKKHLLSWTDLIKFS